MTEKEFVSILQGAGWRVGKDEVGDCFCVMDFSDFQLHIIPTLKKRVDHFRASLAPSVSTREFSKAAAFIFGESDGFEPIILRFEVIAKIKDITPSDVIGLSEDAISWAKDQNIERGLEVYRNLPTDAKGAMPLRHLASLAIAGDVERLASYINNFEDGNRMGFVPYITKEMISRAISVAEGKRGGGVGDVW